LKDKDKACIDLTSPAKLDDLLRVVEEKKAECTKKQWRIPRGHGKETVVLRDIFAKIATWVQKFVQIGDTIMQYDPGHAALPWAAVRFLLQV